MSVSDGVTVKLLACYTVLRHVMYYAFVMFQAVTSCYVTTVFCYTVVIVACCFILLHCNIVLHCVMHIHVNDVQISHDVLLLCYLQVKGSGSNKLSSSKLKKVYISLTLCRNDYKVPGQI